MIARLQAAARPLHATLAKARSLPNKAAEETSRRRRRLGEGLASARRPADREGQTGRRQLAANTQSAALCRRVFGGRGVAGTRPRE